MTETENAQLSTYPATSDDVPAASKTDDCYIQVNVCKVFDYQINMQAQKPDVWSGWSKGSEALRTLIDHSIRIKAADAVRSIMAELKGVKTETLRSAYTAYAQELQESEISKIQAAMIEWCWEGRVTKPKSLEAQLAETIAAQGRIITKARAKKYETPEEIAQAKKELIALQAKRESLEAQLAESSADLDELFD